MIDYIKIEVSDLPCALDDSACLMCFLGLIYDYLYLRFCD